MARLFVPPEKLHDTSVVLGEAAHRHLIRVLRLGLGATIQIFDGQGQEIDAQIRKVERASVVIELGIRRQVPAPRCAIILLQSLPRANRMDLIVQKTTELGVARIIPVLSEHTVTKPAADRRQRWQTIAEEAARQCERSDVPVIDSITTLNEAVRSLTSQFSSRIVLWENEREKPLRQALAEASYPLALLIGPEGGFADGEIETCVQAGFIRASLGQRILRSDTAAIVAVALAQAAAGELG